MHKRKTHEDVERTKASRRSKVFLSRFSYWSTRIHPGTDHQCVYYAGLDCGPMRENALAKAKGRCESCGVWTNRLEVHHIEHKTKVSRCSCPENLLVLCVRCHRGRNGMHMQVRWSERKTEAHEEFAKLMDNAV